MTIDERRATRREENAERQTCCEACGRTRGRAPIFCALPGAVPVETRGWWAADEEGDVGMPHVGDDSMTDITILSHSNEKMGTFVAVYAGHLTLDDALAAWGVKRRAGVAYEDGEYLDIATRADNYTEAEWESELTCAMLNGQPRYAFAVYVIHTQMGTPEEVA
jgi:hypothetical protein